MSVKEQIISDIQLLPEHSLQAISIIVRDVLTLYSETELKQCPVYGSGRGKMWIADDFDAPLEEMKEYME